MRNHRSPWTAHKSWRASGRWGGGGWRRCRGSCGIGGGRDGTEFCGDRKDLVSLGIESERLRPGRSSNGLFHSEAGRRILFDDGEGAVALRAECFHGFGIKGCTIGAIADGKICDDVTVRCGEDDHVFLVATRSEEDVVLGVERKVGAASTFGGDVVAASHLHGLCVDDDDGGFVFDIDVDFAMTVSCGLFRGAANIDGAEDGTILVVEDGNIWRGVANSSATASFCPG